MTPTTTRQWKVAGKDGFSSLKFTEKAEVPKLGDHDVLVNIHYASLNYRDLIITKVSLPHHNTPADPLTIPTRANTASPQI